MRQHKTKIKSFTNLNAWKEGHKLVLMIYETVASFPNNELYGLVSQMKRAVISITSNIAEGFSRQSFKDKIRFYYMAMGSLTELQNQLIIARDVKLLGKNDFTELANQSIKAHKIICGLIRSTKIHSH